MTTIAYKDGELAFESQVSTGESVAGFISKGGVMADGSLWAFCGDTKHLHQIRKWAACPLVDPPTIPDSCIVVITHRGGVLEWEADGWLEISAPMHAWGSGRPYALGAMMAGASPTYAVQCACDVDIWSGGEVTTLRLKPASERSAPSADEPITDAEVMAGFDPGPDGVSGKAMSWRETYDL